MKKSLFTMFLLSSFVVTAHNKDAIYVFNAYGNEIQLDLTWQMNGKGNEGMFKDSRRFMPNNHDQMIKSLDSHYHIFHIDASPFNEKKQIQATVTGVLAGATTGVAVGAGASAGVLAAGVVATAPIDAVALGVAAGGLVGEVAGIQIAQKVNHDKNHHGFRAHKDRYFVVEKKKRDKTGDIMMRRITEVEFHKLVEQAKLASLKIVQSNLQAATLKLEALESAASGAAPVKSQNASTDAPVAA